MSLNNIDLPPSLIAQLYQNVLIEDKAVMAESTKTKQGMVQKETSSQIEWKSLGNNEKNVLITVRYSGITHLPDEQLEFLTQILKSCTLGLNDVAILNLNNYNNMPHVQIMHHFKSKVVLLFGMTTAEFGFPFEILPYHVQSFDNKFVVHAQSLQEIQNDKAAKGKLWTALKKIFNV